MAAGMAPTLTTLVASTPAIDKTSRSAGATPDHEELGLWTKLAKSGIRDRGSCDGVIVEVASARGCRHNAQAGTRVGAVSRKSFAEPSPAARAQSSTAPFIVRSSYAFGLRGAGAPLTRACYNVHAGAARKEGAAKRSKAAKRTKA